jgi:hypothetical protein
MLGGSDGFPGHPENTRGGVGQGTNINKGTMPQQAKANL